jgi:hypothetical protein
VGHPESSMSSLRSVLPRGPWGAVSPNKSLQRSGTHKVLGRGRPSAERTRALRARVLKGRRAAAELSRYAAPLTVVLT